MRKLVCRVAKHRFQQHIQQRIEEDELMQAAGWFATRFPMMQNSWLFNEDNQLTDVGRAYVERE